MSSQQIHAHEVAKKIGYTSLKEAAEQTGESPQTLNNWFKNNRRRFNNVLVGQRFSSVVMTINAD